MMKRYILPKGIVILAMILLLAVAGGCASSQATPQGEVEHTEEMSHEEGSGEGHAEDKTDHDGEGHGEEEEGHDEDAMHSDSAEGEGSTHSHADAERLPNDGAVIEITAPADGDIFKVGDEIVVEVAIENFELDNEGSHWHVYIDGTSYGMVMGDNMDEVLRGVEAGEHELSAYLAVGSHEELEEGGMVKIIVEE